MPKAAKTCWLTSLREKLTFGAKVVSHGRYRPSISAFRAET
jgi:hypothetical protein